MTHPNEDIVRRGHQAFQIGDIDTLRAIYDPEITRGVKLVAIDPSTAATQVTVLVQSAPGAPSLPTDQDLQDGLPDAKTQLEQIGITVKDHRLVTINGHRGL